MDSDFIGLVLLFRLISDVMFVTRIILNSRRVPMCTSRQLRRCLDIHLVNILRHTIIIETIVDHAILNHLSVHCFSGRVLIKRNVYGCACGSLHQENQIFVLFV